MKHILNNYYHEVLRFDRGEEVFNGLSEFLKDKEILSGWIWGLGAAERITISFYDIDKKEYQNKTFEEPLEVLCLEGNVSAKDGLPAVHLHGTFSRPDFSTIGGHVQKLIALGTIEVFIHKIEGKMERKFDQITGLSLLK